LQPPPRTHENNEILESHGLAAGCWLLLGWHRYGYDFTATHASPLDAGCVASSSKDVNIGPTARELFPDPQWWSADVDGVARDLTIAFIRNATRDGRPFYVHFHLHASHATIDPRPEQYNRSYPFATSCQTPRRAAWAAANPGGSGTPGEPCEFQSYYGSQHWADTQRIKPVVDAVDALGIRSSTYIIFSTDNGPASAGQEASKGMALTANGKGGESSFVRRFTYVTSVLVKKY
jgi:arylsulfatase A-like enzyme